MNEHTRPFKPGEHRPVYPGLEDDPYVLRAKLSEPSVCPTCGAVYHRGRWQWIARPQDAKEVVCTACHRMADRLPAGYVYIDVDACIDAYAGRCGPTHGHGRDRNANPNAGEIGMCRTQPARARSL